MAASILIADDDPVQRRLVENMVQKCGYEAVVAESGDAAIAMLSGGDAPTIDAVLCGALLEEELTRLRASAGAGRHGEAAGLLQGLIEAQSFPEFLTLPAYEMITAKWRG